MNVLKRSLLYVTRKKVQTVILLLLFCIVSTFLISCFSILDASDILAKDLRTSIGGAFYLRPNSKFDYKDGGLQQTEDTPIISQEMIDDIMKKDNIKYYNALNYGYARSDNISFIPGNGHNVSSNMGKVSAMNYTSLADQFLEEKLKIIDGRHIVKNDKNKILISEQLAKANKIKVGDHVRFTHSGLERKNNEYIDSIPNKTAFSEVEVVGIYKETNQQMNDAKSPTPGRNENLIFSDHNFLFELEEHQSGEFSGEVNFYLSDPLLLHDSTDAIKELDIIKSGEFSLRENDFQYSKIADSLKSMEDLTQILIVCVSIITIIILILILMMRIRGRIREAGILLAIGKTKKEIIIQFICEVLVLFVLAFICATIISILATGIIENVLVNGIPQTNVDLNSIDTGLPAIENTKFNLHIRAITTLLIFICQTITLIIVVSISCGSIFSFKPKEILTKMS